MSKPNAESGPKRKDDDCDMVTSLQASDLSKNELCLHEAARQGNDILLKKIIRKNAANIQCRNNLDRTALHMAASQGHLKAVEILISSKATIDAVDKYGMTPLLWAAYFGQSPVFTFLIEKGANINKKNKHGCDCTHLLAEGNWVTMMEYMFRKYKHYKYDEPDNNGSTPFLIAISKNNYDIAKVLSEKNIHLLNVDKCRRNCWHLAAKNGNGDSIKLLRQLESPLEILNDRDNDNKTALYYACENGENVVVEQLLEAGAHTEITAKNGMTPLLIASQKTHLETCTLLLKYKANINAQNEQGNTPLHLATLANNAQLVGFLLDNNASKDILNKREQTPLQAGVEQNKCDSVELLLLRCENRDELFSIDKTGKTPLLMAARSSYIGMVDMIIKADRLIKLKENLHTDDCDTEKTIDQLNGSAFRPSDFHNVYNIHVEETKKVVFNIEEYKIKDFNQPYAEEFKLYLWKIAFNHLRVGEWKKLAHFWNFEPEHILAIEYQHVPQTAYKYHGYRLLCIWFHGIGNQETPIRGLYEALVSIGRRKLADKIRRQLDERSKSQSHVHESRCVVS